MSGLQVTGSTGPIDRTLFERAAQNLDFILGSARASGAPVAQFGAIVDGVVPPPSRPDPVDPREVTARLGGWLSDIVTGTDAAMGNIQVFNPATSALHLRAQQGFKAPFLAFFREVHTNEAACGTAFRSRATVIVSDVATSPLFTPEAREVMLEAEARAVQSTHLATPHLQKIGVLSVHYRHPGIAEESQLKLRRFAAALSEVMALCVPCAPVRPPP